MVIKWLCRRSRRPGTDQLFIIGYTYTVKTRYLALFYDVYYTTWMNRRFNYRRVSFVNFTTIFVIFFLKRKMGNDLLWRRMDRKKETKKSFAFNVQSIRFGWQMARKGNRKLKFEKKMERDDRRWRRKQQFVHFESIVFLFCFGCCCCCCTHASLSQLIKIFFILFFFCFLLVILLCQISLMRV